MELNRDIAKKVLDTVDAGLTSGLGNNKPGEMCIEAAVCYAFDLPHGDNPSCVGSAVRSYAIRLNDANWPTDKARADGMRKFSIAQLGSNTIDQEVFRKIVVEAAMRKMVPIAMRAAAKLNPNFAQELELVSVKCETAAISELRDVVIEARNLARKVYAADAAAYAAAAAADAADYAADAAAYAAAAAADAAAYAADAAYAAAAYAYAYAYADAARIQILNIAAQIGLDALIELKSPGCEYLDLCE